MTDASGNPIKDAKVDILFYMPPMPEMGMPAMKISAKAEPAQDSLYLSKVEIPRGLWQVRVIVTEPGKPSVSKVFEVNVM